MDDARRLDRAERLRDLPDAGAAVRPGEEANAAVAAPSRFHEFAAQLPPAR